MDDIAIVGVGLRFPGEAKSPDTLWEVLEEGRSQWTEFPKDRLNINGYYHPGGERQGTISFKGGHFLKDDISVFDAPFFAITAADAKAIDPQQRLLLEVCYEAIENAGCTKEELDGSNTSVYVGSFVKDYEQICLRDPDWQPQYAATGNGIAIMANRISYFFNLHGPSMTIDTGCSGSLVAVHLAAQSLRNGESSMAIAAGAGMILTPNTIMPMTALNFLSPDGKCFTFDSRANGYGRGEGIGVVVLKRVEDAIKNNDHIRAIIRASQVNQDGRTKGITLPSKEAQVANITSVYKNAGLPFEDTGYVECHGTGTQAGDWRELKAISETLASVRRTENPLLVGSIKPNIGHLEGAAGVAGLIKGILMLENGKIPPHINFETPNPDIAFEDWKVKVTRSALPWPQNCLRRVSVNCFGFGGTNAHVILDGAVEYFERRAAKTLDTQKRLLHSSDEPKNSFSSENSWQLFVYSANERAGLRRILDSHVPVLENSENQTQCGFLHNYAYTLACRRSQWEWKSFFVANSASSLAEKIQKSDGEPLKRSAAEALPKICFLFCGQGSQWAKMGFELRSFPSFWNSVSCASWYLKSTLGCNYDLLEEIGKSGVESNIASPLISQPAVTAIQVALVDLLATLSIKPHVVVGHSSGEIAAAYASGAISREEAWEVSYYRGLASASVETRNPGLRGGMLAVGLSEEKALEYIKPMDEQVEVACVNSPSSVTLSGKKDALGSLEKLLTANGVFNRALDVSTPYHSSYMKPVEEDYISSLCSISPTTSDRGVIMVSSVTGDIIDGSRLNASYWAQNIGSTVQYAVAIQTVSNFPEIDGRLIFLEVGPSPILKTPTIATLSSLSSQIEPVFLSTMDRRQPSMEYILHLVGNLWTLGHKLNLKSLISRRICQERLKCLSTLPSYPWNHDKSYWHESHLSIANRFREFGRQDLIGAPTADSVLFEPHWRGFLRISENPWMQDHQVQKAVIYPAAGMVSMVLEGARQLKSHTPGIFGYEIQNMSIDKALIVPNTLHGVEVALNMRLESVPQESLVDGMFSFAIYSKQLDREWEKHSTGSVKLCNYSENWATMFQAFDGQFQKVEADCGDVLNPRQLYEHLDTAGISYGPLFRNILEVNRGHDRLVGRIGLPDTRSKMPANFEYPHLIHPATLDSMFQMLFSLEPLPMVPIYLQSLFISDAVGEEPKSPFTGYAIAEKTNLNQVDAQISMRSEKVPSAQILIKGLHMSGEIFSSSANSSFLPNYRGLCTEVIWREDVATAGPTTLKELIELLSHKFPGLSVLQRGGTASLFISVLLSLSSDIDKPPRLQRYSLVDYGTSDPWKDTIRIVQSSPLAKFIDIVSDKSKLHAKYHLIIDCDGADPLAVYLKREGVLVQELTPADHLSDDLATGLPKRDISIGWTVQEIQQEWLKRFSSAVKVESMDINKAFTQTWPAQDLAETLKSVVLLVPSDPENEELTIFITILRKYMKDHYPDVDVGTATIDRLVDDALLFDGRTVISLLDFGRPDGREQYIYSWESSDFSAFYKLQKQLTEAIWVTRGAHMAPVNPHASPIIGLLRTLMSEDPRKLFATLDLAASSRLFDEHVIELLWVVCQTLSKAPGRDEPPELDYAEQNGRLYIPRLEPIHSMNQLIEEDDSFSVAVGRSFQAICDNSGRRADLELAPKTLAARNGPTTFCFSDCFASGLGPDDVEITYQQSVLCADACCRGFDGTVLDFGLAMDIVGQVGAVGTNVTQFQPGDKVAALVPDRTALRTTTKLDVSYVAEYQTGFVPSFFVGAYYALVYIGKLRRNKTILVHGGAGGFSLAALELGLAVGADLYVTVFGEKLDEQRRLLEQRGIRPTNIIDASDDSYVAVVNLLTSGKGVDVLYNPTPHHSQSSPRCVKTCGTIIQFANEARKSQLGSQHVSPSTVVSLDIGKLLLYDKSLSKEIIGQTVQLFKEISLGWMAESPWVASFDISRLHDGVSHAQCNPQVGYVTITATLSSEGGSPVRVFNQNATTPLHERVQSNETYLLVGGLGGLGRSIARLLVASGARHLAFISRSGCSSLESQQFLAELVNDQKVDARVYAVDACDKDALTTVIQSTIASEMPRICGVFQCAAVVKDSVFENMTFDRWAACFKPKAVASWNIVQAIEGTEQDPFYVFLASSAGVIGTRGQANYAAGNVFLDSLARSLRIKGRRAVSVDLGPILGAGMLTEDEAILDMLRASGFYGIRHQDFLKVIKHAITMETFRGQPLPPQVVLGVGTGGLMAQNEPADPYWSRTSLYSFLNIVDAPKPDLSSSSQKGKSTDVKAQLMHCTDATAATNIVCLGLANMLAKSMNMLPEEIDVMRPANVYGVDSLVAVGVRNWVLGHCNVHVSVFEVMSDMTILTLAKSIVEKGQIGRA